MWVWHCKEHSAVGNREPRGNAGEDRRELAGKWTRVVCLELEG